MLHAIFGTYLHSKVNCYLSEIHVFHWVLSILPDNPTPSILRLEARLLLTACKACVIWPCLSPSVILHHPLLHDHTGEAPSCQDLGQTVACTWNPFPNDSSGLSV